MITLAIDARLAAPGPCPSAMGIIPAMSVTVVIRIGRRRLRFASMIAGLELDAGRRAREQAELALVLARLERDGAHVDVLSAAGAL